MKMKMKTSLPLFITLLGVALTLGCSSSSSNDDGGTDGDVSDTGTTTDGGGPFGLTPTPYCYDVVAIAPGFVDGCMLGVDQLVGGALPVDYEMPTAQTGTLTVGTMGSLGTGNLSNDMGTLLADSNTSFSDMPTCTFHAKVTSKVTLTATNQFNIAVTQINSGYASVCSPPLPPDPCTSTWTWTMKINGTKTVPGCK